MISRRGLFGSVAVATAAAGVAKAQSSTGLTSIVGAAKPITTQEREARIAKAQGLMAKAGLAALICEAGAAMEYFTGVKWWRSERLTCAVIPAKGQVVIVTPVFEEPSIRESLAVDGDVRPWNEDESPIRRIVQALADRGASAGPVGVEQTVRFFVIDGLRKEAPSLQVVSGESVVRACRMIKSPAELALMQAASDVTMAAYRWVHPRVKTGMSQGEIGAMMADAQRALGGDGDGGLVLLNEASAYPHGSHKPQVVREGSVVLMDTGCSVLGYQSDISRTWVHGEPSAKQRKVWQTVKRGQEIALETARIGRPCAEVDHAVRRYYESQGWGPAYRLPGLPHRTGHGIGMEGHEPSFLVGNDETPLQAGMCFSDEPGLYTPGEFGIRLEDCFHMTESGPVLFSGLAKSLEDPI